MYWRSRCIALRSIGWGQSGYIVYVLPLSAFMCEVLVCPGRMDTLFGDYASLLLSTNTVLFVNIMPALYVEPFCWCCQTLIFMFVLDHFFGGQNSLHTLFAGGCPSQNFSCCILVLQDSVRALHVVGFKQMPIAHQILKFTTFFLSSALQPFRLRLCDQQMCLHDF